MLHIGKTGGSYTHHILSSVGAANSLVRFLDHSFTLESALDAFPNEKAIFGIRDPGAIFVSGFYSRMRRGQPRYNSPWSPAEAIAFSAFHTPNEVAEALSSDIPELKASAEFSMSEILHVARCLHFYLKSASAVHERKSRISFILRQESLDEDIQRFLNMNGFSNPQTPVLDSVIRHSNPVELDRRLSPLALRNLEFWYKTDYEIYNECQTLASRINCS